MINDCTLQYGECIDYTTYYNLFGIILIIS